MRVSKEKDRTMADKKMVWLICDCELVSAQMSLLDCWWYYKYFLKITKEHSTVRAIRQYRVILRAVGGYDAILI